MVLFSFLSSLFLPPPSPKKQLFSQLIFLFISSTVYQNLDEIIGHSKRISSFTSAPPNYDSNKPLLPAEPPYPIELVMRAGLINQYNSTKAEKADEIKEEAQETDIIDYIEQENNFDIDPSSFLFDLDLNPDLE
ncbi:hypothetical protein AYI69_g3914 [Smittium culicis]|uniref:Mediator of RNA polymerase II transcription subunit 4 n=1 Tax=Smittium culicis TaxID=133412 RepID=A0A1R1YIY3_9FUNG|nr:hypothetical protein AYI69_g7090 [Smittium culicis]OMJ26676.1 hypothetical protein AYI69_g3914 [Smittium culicis]